MAVIIAIAVGAFLTSVLTVNVAVAVCSRLF